MNYCERGLRASRDPCDRSAKTRKTRRADLYETIIDRRRRGTEGRTRASSSFIEDRDCKMEWKDNTRADVLALVALLTLSCRARKEKKKKKEKEKKETKDKNLFRYRRSRDESRKSRGGDSRGAMFLSQSPRYSSRAVEAVSSIVVIRSGKLKVKVHLDETIQARIQCEINLPAGRRSADESPRWLLPNYSGSSRVSSAIIGRTFREHSPPLAPPSFSSIVVSVSTRQHLRPANDSSKPKGNFSPVRSLIFFPRRESRRLSASLLSAHRRSR
jgi:hypothetical protein